MKKITVVLTFFAILPCFMMAQAKKKPATQTTPTQSCLFERLFSLKPGMDMPSVIAALNKYSRIVLQEETSEKRKPYAATGGDSILLHTITYRIDSADCLKGKVVTAKFDFADGRLYKAYMESMYSGNEFPEMMTSFNSLHQQILKSWKIEKQVTMKGEGSEGFGYNFYKTLDKKVKLDMCTLQYVKDKGSSPGSDKYHLEILWVNLNNTRMENSMY